MNYTIRINKATVVSLLVYVLIVYTYIHTLVFGSMGTEISRMRYFAIAFGIVFSICSLIQKHGLAFVKKNTLCKDFLYVIPVAVVFLCVSLNIAKKEGVSLNYRTFVQIGLFLLPILYTFCILNIFKMSTIIQIMKFSLIVITIGYFMESSHTIPKFFDIRNWKNISFGHSFTESSLCSELFTQLFLFFGFYKNAVDKDGKRIFRVKPYYYFSFIFAILSFKRISVLFVILMFVYNIFSTHTRNTKHSYLIPASLGFSILTVFYLKFMRGMVFTGINVFQFSSGRDYILGLWEAHGFCSYGYGTSMLIIGRYLEMDLIQIYIELGMIPLLLFCLFFFSMVKKNIYCMLIMIYVFFQMLMASVLPGFLALVFLFITIGTIVSEKYKIDGYTYKKEINNQTVRNDFSKYLVVRDGVR